MRHVLRKPNLIVLIFGNDDEGFATQAILHPVKQSSKVGPETVGNSRRPMKIALVASNQQFS